ncbi:MAG: peptidylprolyl isomerase [Lachnospiraceae bacterium]|nr:peptidylprolyl isomerase [Lachnospiraceae bacterium]
MKKLLTLFISCLLFLTACGTREYTVKAVAPTPTQTPTPTEVPEDSTEGEKILALIDMKDYGTITVLLRPDCAPATVENFVKLAESGFYDGLTFHRIIKGFMMQGGDPSGTGFGGSSETIPGEFIANGYDNPLKHTRGVISMARTDDMNSASSQFFIMHQDYPPLDGLYAAFGLVTDGQDIVDEICESAKPSDKNGSIPADQQPVINSITIVRE